MEISPSGKSRPHGRERALKPWRFQGSLVRPGGARHGAVQQLRTTHTVSRSPSSW